MYDRSEGRKEQIMNNLIGIILSVFILKSVDKSEECPNGGLIIVVSVLALVGLFSLIAACGGSKAFH